MATAAEVQTAYRAIVRTDLNATVAQSIADAINNGTTSLDAYIASLVTQNTTSTGAAVAITSFVTGVAPSSAQLDALKVAADAQIASYTKLGVANPSLAAFEAFGRGLAVDSSTTAGFNTKYGSLSTADFITSVYFQVYGTNPSAAAAANLTAQINYFTTLYTQNNIPNAALAAKGAVLGQIVGYAFVSDASSVATIDNQVVSFLNNVAKGDGTGYGQVLPAAGQIGPVIALTTAADNLTGTAGNDTFSGFINLSTGTTDTTLTAGDIINGGAGTDSLNITVSGTGTGSLPAATITNVENFFIRDLGATGGTYDFGTISGEQQVWSDRSTSAVNFANIADGTTVGLKGDGSTVLGAVAFESAAAGAAVKIAIDGGVGTTGTAPTITNGGVVGTTTTNATSATISSTGAANTVGAINLSETANSVTSLTVNASANLTATLTAGNYATAGATLAVTGTAAKVDLGTAGVFKTIDASGLTQGGLTIGLSTLTTSFKGGQGSDVVTSAALTSTTAGIIDGGAGNDVLVAANATDLDSAVKGSRYTNFETLRVSGSQNTANVAGITAVEINAATSAVISGLTATQAGAITVRGDQSTALTLTLADATGSSDVVSLKLQNPTETAATKADVDIAGLSVIGVETLNVQNVTGGTSIATADAATLNSLAFAAGGANKLSTINISGDRSIDLSLANVGGVVTVNNSSTGSAALLLSAGATAAGSVVNGTANGDDLTVGTVSGVGTVAYNAGAGNDTIRVTAANIVGNVIDGGAGTDTLSFAAGASTLVDAAFQRVTNVEKIAFLATTDATSLTSGGFFDTNFKSGGVEITATAATSGAVTIDLTSFTGKATVTTGNATATATQAVTTGSGDDVISLNGAAASLTAVGGAGNDTITINGTAATTAAVATGGAGKDVITFASAIVNGAAAEVITVNVGAGESIKTAYDSVSGFDLGTAAAVSSKLDFDGTATVATNFTASAVTGFTSAELTASSTNGIITFAGSSAAGLTLAQKIEAADALINTDNATAAFVHNGNTYVFHDSASAGGDSLVELVGVTAASLITTNATTANALFIA